MKKLLIILIALVTILSGCRYKEGPLISFRSVEKRICGIWQVVEFTSDGIDSLQYYNDTCGAKVLLWKKSFDSVDDNINFEQGKKGFSGTFTFSKNKKVMKVYMNDGFPTYYWHLGPIGSSLITSNWKILKLTTKDLKISTDFNGRNYIISFKKE
jgi:hypothetical protein